MRGVWERRMYKVDWRREHYQKDNSNMDETCGSYGQRWKIQPSDELNL